MRVNTTAEKKAHDTSLVIVRRFPLVLSLICLSVVHVIPYLSAIWVLWRLCACFLCSCHTKPSKHCATALDPRDMQDTQSSNPEKCLLQLGQLLCQCITEKIIPLREGKCWSSEGLGRGEGACERGSLILHEIITSSINYPAHWSR